MKSVSDRVVFTTTVDEGSFTRAASRLGLSLAVCSKRLSNLEKQLGVRLLNRTTRSLHLTDEGAVYYEHCLQIQEDIDAVEAGLAGMRDTVQGCTEGEYFSVVRQEGIAYDRRCGHGAASGFRTHLASEAGGNVA